MAQRYAKLDLSDLSAFVTTWTGSLEQGAVVIPADAVDDELHATFKLDLALPFGRRAGPIECQVIQRMPDGSTAARIPDMPPAVGRTAKQVFRVIDQVRAYLLDTGSVVEPGSQEAVAAPVEPEQAPVAQVAPAVVPRDAPPESLHEHRPDGYRLPSQVADQAEASGSLKDRSLRDFLVDAALNESTGLLTVVEPDGVKRFGFWMGGGPVGWRREPIRQEETLGGLLLRARKIDQDKLEQALDRMRETRVRLGSVLVDMGVIKAAQLGVVLRKQAEFILQLIFRSNEGVWAFHPCDGFPERFLIQPVNVPEVLFRAMVAHSKNINSERIYAGLRPSLNHHVKIRGSAEALLESFEWTKNETRFHTLLKTEPRLRRVFSITPLTKAETLGSLWALNDLGFIQFGQDDTKREDRSRMLRRISGPIQARAKLVASANAFDVLRLSWICCSPEVEAAYTKWSGRFARDRFPDLPDELDRALADIERATTDAYERLRDDDQRRQARLDLVGQTLIDDSAALLADKALELESERQWREAQRCWAQAVDLCPDREDWREKLHRLRAVS